MARAEGLISRYRGDYQIDQVPLTTAEEQCLLNRLARDEGNGLISIARKIGNHPLIIRLGGADRITAIVAAVGHVLGGTGNDDWCNRPGPLGRNRGLSLYAETQVFSVPDARIADAVKAKVGELKGRPLTWSEAVAVALGLTAGAASLAVP